MRPRWGGCGSGGGVGGVASRRRLARLGGLGACASGRAARRPSEVARGLRGVTSGFARVLQCFSVEAMFARPQYVMSAWL